MASVHFAVSIPGLGIDHSSHQLPPPANRSDDLNSWEGGANCETLYEWEVVTSPGLVPRAYSSQTINPCTQCTTGACNGILADITDLPGKWKSTASAGQLPKFTAPHAVTFHLWPLSWPAICKSPTELHDRVLNDQVNLSSSFVADDRYQVFILAYNQFGYTRSPASNVVTVGTPTSEPPTIMGTDGDGQITIGVSPAVSTAVLIRNRTSSA